MGVLDICEDCEMHEADCMCEWRTEMYKCERCLEMKFDNHKLRDGKRVCQKCSRQIDKRKK